jgi:sugar phosphate isomerase/epimerase
MTKKMEKMKKMNKSRMAISRRDFLRSVQVLGAGMLLPAAHQNAFAGSGKKKDIAVQLWTFRDLLKDDLDGVLTEISRMGFTGIEPYGFDGSFYGITARDFRKKCRQFNLAIYGTHTDITAENAAAYSEKAVEAGMQYLILPSLMGRPGAAIDDYKKLAEEMNQIGETCLNNNLMFGYHNHAFEFSLIDGVMPYDILLKETDPGLVCFQPDFYFFAKAGIDPLVYFRQYPGRFYFWHIKDLAADGDSCIVGNGVVNFKQIIQSAQMAGLQLMVYEQESCAEGDLFYCAEQSIKYIQSHLL